MNFLFACGGTAGHINPAIALAQKLGQLMPDANFLFIGAEGNMEMELVPKEGYEIRAIKAGSLHRSLRPDELLRNVRSAYYLCVSTRKAAKIMKQFKPDAVLGTGGYVCYPVIRAASQLGIPTLIHESNAFPGLTTRMLEKYADRLMVGFEESRSYYKYPEKVVFTGTPARSGFGSLSSDEAKKELGAENVPLVLSFWGSLGASHMNEVTAQMIAMNEKDGAFRHIHASGGENAPEKMEAALGGIELKNTEIRRYIYDMPKVMAAADVVICRAGASTLCELTAMGKPAVLVPSINVTNNHQEKNARVLADRGGAVLIREEDCTPRKLYDTVTRLCSDADRRAKMSEAMLSMARPDAADAVIGEILDAVRQPHTR